MADRRHRGLVSVVHAPALWKRLLTVLDCASLFRREGAPASITHSALKSLVCRLLCMCPFLVCGVGWLHVHGTVPWEIMLLARAILKGVSFHILF